jgi:hypothetical protein
LAQGYGISRPIPPLAFEAWLSEWIRPDSWRNSALQLPSIHNSAIVFAEVGHRAWMRQIENYLMHKTDAPPPMSHSDCHLGQWIAREGKAYFGQFKEFNELIELHKLVHECGCKILISHAKLNESDVQIKLIKLTKLRDEVISKLRLLCG